MEDLPTDGTSITIRLEYDIKHSGAHAIDFLTHYNRLQPHSPFGHTAETINPISGVAGAPSTYSTYAIPAPSSVGSPVAGQPTSRFNSLPSAEKLMTLYGGTITNVAYATQGDLSANAASTSIDITFTASSATAVLAWGGHIAQEPIWGVDQSAGGISGSPYHMRLLNWNLGNLGNQDRSLSAGAVAAPSSITIIKNANPDSAQDFSFTTTGNGLSPFSLDDDSDNTLSNTVTFNSLLAGTFTVTEDTTAGWTLDPTISCSSDGTGSTNSSIAQGISIGLVAGENVTCTFVNTQQNGSIKIVKNTIGGNGTFDFTSTDLPSTSFSLTTSSNTAEKLFSDISAGTYDVSEDVKTGWTPTSATCSDGSLISAINLAGGEDIICTFTNTRDTGSIELTKSWSGTAGQTTLNIGTTAGGSEIDNQLTGVSGAIPLTTGKSTVTTGTYYVSENGGLGDYDSSLVCRNQSGVVSVGTNDSVIVDKDDVVVCTFTNTREQGKIELQKDFVGTAESVTIKIGTTSGGNELDSDTLSADGTTGEQTVNTGTFFVSEELSNLSNYDISLSCYNDLNDNDIVDTGDTSHSFDSTSGAVSVSKNDDVICVITNTRKTGKLFIDKILVGGGPAIDSSWTFGIYSLTGSILGTLTDDGTHYWITLDTGSYTVTESNNVPGYTLSATGGVCADLDGQSATATVSVGDDNTCSFTNTRDKGSIKVNKQVDSNGDGVYEGGNTEAETIGFKWTLNDGTENDMGASLSDLPTTVDSLVYSVNENINSVEDYHFVGWFPTGSTEYSCSNPEGTTLPITVNVAKNSTTEITLCNARDTGSIKIIKDAVPNNSQNFTFSTTGGTLPSTFQLDDDSNGTLPKSRTYTVPTGDYSITESIVSGWELTGLVCTDNNNSSWDLGSRVAHLSVEIGEKITCTFTNTKYGSIQGRKYNDLDGNGSLISSEPYLNDWTIKLFDSNMQELQRSITGAGSLQDGQYRFANLLPGSYYICEDQKVGWTQTDPTSGQDYNGTHCRQVTLAAGQNRTGVHLGNFKLGKVSGYKWYDADEDGIKDSGESVLSDWTINLGGSSDVTDANGYYEFTGLIAGSYSLSEDMQTGWAQTHSPTTPLVVTSGLDLTEQNFGNRGDLSITACKWEDNNGRTEGTSGSGINWNFSLGDLTQYTNDDNDEVSNCTTFTHLRPGTYLVEEGDDEGWYSADDNITQSATLIDEDVTLNFYNYQKGSISGYKWNDINGNSERDCIFGDNEREECEYSESKIAGWTIFLDEINGEEESANGVLDNGEVSTITDSYGNYTFTDLEPGNYKVCEVVKVDWIQTYPNNQTKCHNLTINSGDDLTYQNFGNQAKPVLRIQKSNDATGSKNPGDVVTYTLIVDLADSSLENVLLTDVAPDGFTYVSGSWTSSKAGVAEPDYGSPGTWDLGDMVPGDTVTLTYQAKISTDQDGGIYNDLAWAEGSSEGWGPVLALGHNSEFVDAEEVFVGTDVEVKKSVEQTGTVNIEKMGEVLGASTELPATGADTGWLLLALGSLISGLFLIFGGKRMQKLFIAAIILLAPFTRGLATSAQAADPSNNLSVRVEQPATPIRVTEWKLSFSVLGRAGGYPTVNCFVKKPGAGSFVSFGATHTSVKEMGDNGNCQVNNSVLGEQGNYEFYVTAVAGSDSEDSARVTVNYDASGPGTPGNFSKDHPSFCRWVIKFHTADDAGATVKVDIFSSDQKNFDTNNGTRVGTVNIGSNQDGVFNHDRANACDKEYYYVIRAYDNAGNQSGHVGDEMTTITTVSASPTTGALVTTYANGNVLGKDTKQGDQSTGDVLGEDSTAAAETVSGDGLVDSAKAAVQKTIQNKSFWWIVLTIIALRIVYGISRKKTNY